MASSIYGLALDGFLNQGTGYDWTAGSIQLACVTSGYTPNYSTHQYLGVAVSGGDIVAQSGTFTTLASSLGTANADPETLPSVSGSAFSQVLIYSFITDNNSSPLILNINGVSGLPCTPNGGNIVLQWDTGTNKIFTLCHEVDFSDWVKTGAKMIADWLGRAFGTTVIDRTYGGVYIGQPRIIQLPPTAEQAAANAAWQERQAKAREISRRFGGRIPVLAG